MTEVITPEQVDEAVEAAVAALEKSKHLYTFDTVNGSIRLDNGVVLVLNYGAHCNFEDEAEGEILDNLLVALKDANARAFVPRKFIRAAYYVAAKQHQPEITLDEAGELVRKYPDALFYAELASKGETLDGLKEKLADVLKKSKEMILEANKKPSRKKSAKTDT